MDNSIEKWIEQVRIAGLSDKQIYTQLLEKGYTNDDISSLLYNENIQPDNDKLRLSYRLLMFVKWAVIFSSFLVIINIYSNGFAFTLFYFIFIVVGWIIYIPSAIVYKKKTNKKIGILNSLIVFLSPIITTILIFLLLGYAIGNML